MWLKFSAKPILMIKQEVIKQEDDRGGAYRKPSGFWITDDSKDNWYDWCVGEQWCLGGLRYKYEVQLNESNILFLKGESALQQFTDSYGKVYRYGSGFKQLGIDWSKVASEFDGIIITPYVWQLRLDLTWYYPWDCASGCIWNTTVIKDLVLLSEQIVHPRKEDA